MRMVISSNELAEDLDGKITILDLKPG